MTDSGGRPAGGRRSSRGPAQWLLGLLLILAIGASIAMIFSRDRSIVASLAVIAALWAAVIGAILVTRFRRAADTAEARTRDLRVVYELQLEREIAARRQYELGVEAQIRREVRAESTAELRALQDQVAALRASVEALIGDLPDQRIALEGERLRALAPVDDPVVSDGVTAERDFATTVPEGPAFDDAPTDEWVPSTPLTAPPVVTPDATVEPTPTIAPTPPDDGPVQPAPAGPATPIAPAAPTQRGADEEGGRRRHGRETSDDDGEPAEVIADATPAWTTSVEAPARRDRHRAPDTDRGAHSSGRSAAELMESLRSTGGGRRRRRED